MSYSQLHERSLRCAQGLLDAGVGVGDRVALWLPNSHAYLDLLYACMQVGAIAVSVNTRLRRAEAESIVRRTGASVLVVAPTFKHVPALEMIADLDLDAGSTLKTVVLCDAPSDALATRRLHVLPHSALLESGPAASISDASLPCAIFPTSGTTNLPKFALHRQGEIARHAAQVAPAFGYDRTAHLLLAIPLCGIFGFSQMMATVAGQASATMMSIFDPQQAASLIRQSGITHLNGPDDLVKRLLDAVLVVELFTSIRDCLIASFNPTLAAFPAEAERRGIRMTNGFGMSEIFSFFSRPPAGAPLSLRQLSGGLPVNPEAHVRARDQTSGELLPPGEVGSLEVRSDTIFCEDYGYPVATSAAFTPDGNFIPGDLASVEGDGSFLFKGRNGDFLRLGGFLVNPAEIEVPLQKVPGVETVVAVEANTERGNKPVAFVRMMSGRPMDAAQLRAVAEATLADFKVPVRFIEVTEFPVATGPNGEKIQRAKLKIEAAKALVAQT